MVAALLAVGMLHGASPAHASLVIHINEALAIRTDQSTTRPPGGYVIHHEAATGIGVTNVKFGLRAWLLSLQVDQHNLSGRCELLDSYSVGSWSLKALDGSGDNLYGVINGSYYGVRWKVTRGTGRYNSVTDANPDGVIQPFYDTPNPDVLGLGGGAGPCPQTLGLWTGSLTFTIE